ncbi:hypothetical protein HD554DRAFT_2206419 [Boletus coccyginus]|nr:hypothetical protein HD554DRAFT_2206419 [Boletus coccyginus]
MQQVEDLEEITQHFEFFSHAIADILGTDVTSFEWMKIFQDNAGKGLYALFVDHEEWELVWWSIKTLNQHVTNKFLKLPIDLELIESDAPDGQLNGNTNTKELELWMRDPVTCIQELIGNPTFNKTMVYAPEKEHLSTGATIAPVIIASDKTHLSCLKGNKTTWPVYLSIGNLFKQVRCESSQHGMVLLGYLPALKLASFEDNSICLVACCIENHCPKCLVPANQQGTNKEFTLCNQTQTKQTLHVQATGQYPPSFIADGLQPIFLPFWADLPHTDIFIYISSDILHQLHQGIFKDHLKKWCAAIAGSVYFNACICLQHFNDDISKIRQWTGAKHKQLQWVFISSLIGITTESHIHLAACSLIDFIYLLGLYEHFNILKVHSLLHYIDMIKNLGSLDGVNTENSEYLHIDHAKKAYTASSQKDYTIQITKWLQHQEVPM